MSRAKPLTQLTLADLWAHVKGEEDWWYDIKAESLRIVKRILEAGMEEDLLVRLAARWHQRTPRRRGDRNGHYQRDIFTELGLIEGLRVPRARNLSADLGILERYQRRQVALNRLVRRMFLAGVSTRRVSEVLEPLVGTTVSAQTVSRITRGLEAELQSLLEPAPRG